MADRACVSCGATFVGKAGRVCCFEACRRALNPPTCKPCGHCGVTFGPVGHLARRFCSHACKVKAQATGRRTVRKTLRFARSAQSLLRYHVQAGHITRPAVCEGCGTAGRKIEGTHYDYAEPLRVRWLCRSCHSRWDKREPKGVTYAAPISPHPPARDTVG